MPELDLESLWKRAEHEFRLKGALHGLDLRGSLHGLDHWRRVEANGLLLAEQTGADEVVVRLFALFHDCKRQNDHDDPEHGRRAARFVTEQRGELPISDEQFALLREAIASHADGTTHHNATIGTCWDADRLDLTRCGMTPAPQFLSTMAGRAEAGKRRK